MQSSLASSCLLVHLIHNKAGQYGVNGNPVYGNEERADRETDDEDNLSDHKCTISR